MSQESVPMNYSKSDKKTFRFNFWKDRFWLWFLLLPIGISCWIFPICFSINFRTDFPTLSSLFLFLFFAGIPCFLAGWIFIYQVMVWFYMQVTIDNNWIIARYPMQYLPIIPKIYKIYIPRIERIEYGSSFGLGFAFNLYYRDEKNYLNRFPLPIFRFNREYGKAIDSILQKVDPEQEKFVQTERIKNAIIKTTLGENSNKKSIKRKAFPILNLFLKILILACVCWICVSNIWIIYSVFPQNPAAHFAAFGSGMLLAFLGLFGKYPFLGQLLIWVFGKNIIILVLNSLFQIQADILFMNAPDWVNKIFAFLNLKPLDTSFVNYLFYPILVLSIVISLQKILKRLRSA